MSSPREKTHTKKIVLYFLSASVGEPPLPLFEVRPFKKHLLFCVSSLKYLIFFFFQIWDISDTTKKRDNHSLIFKAYLYFSGDYDEWSSLGVEGWAYKDVLPFFKKSENYVDDLQNDDRKI